MKQPDGSYTTNIDKPSFTIDDFIIEPVEGVIYTVEQTDDGVKIIATPDDDYEFPPNTKTEWDISVEYIDPNIEVTPVKPVLRDKDGNEYPIEDGKVIIDKEDYTSDDFTINPQEGIDFTITVNPDGSVSVKAEPQDGYKLPDDVDTEWNYDVEYQEPLIEVIPPEKLIIKDKDGNEYEYTEDGKIIIDKDDYDETDFIIDPEEGIDYEVTVNPDGSVTIEAKPDEGYKFPDDVDTEWNYDVEKVDGYWGTSPVLYNEDTKELTVFKGTLAVQNIKTDYPDIDVITFQEGVDTPVSSNELISNNKVPNTVTKIQGDLNTSETINMAYMFYGARSLSTLDVSNWDTSNVTDMSYMFRNASSLSTLDVSNWDTSNVTDMSYMFRNASSLSTLDVSNWDTSNVTTMFHMFFSASSLSILDVSNWDTSNVTDMSTMFEDASSLQYLKLGENSIFSLQDVNLPNPPSNSEYTGKWINISDNTTYNSSDSFMANYDGTHPGWYTWERVDGTLPSAPYNIEFSLNVPDKKHTKAEIVEYLKANNIDFKPSMTKAELLELIRG